MKDNGLLILLLGVGGLVWYMSSQTTTATTSPQTTTGTGGTPPAVPPTAPTPVVPVNTTQTAPSYSGPSLAQMYASLQTAVIAKLGTDPALTCTTGMSGLGQGGHTTVAGGIPARSVTIPETRGGMPAPIAGGVGPRLATPINTRTVGTCTPDDIQATFEVFNYYLLQAVPSIGSVPNAPAGDPAVSLSDYWAWAAPLLQSQLPGLSGIGAAMYAPMKLTRPGNGEYQVPKIPRSYMYGRWSA